MLVEHNVQAWPGKEKIMQIVDIFSKITIFLMNILRIKKGTHLFVMGVEKHKKIGKIYFEQCFR
jgi:hypothetical protein